MLAGSTAVSGTHPEGVPAQTTLRRALAWARRDTYRLGVSAIAVAFGAFLLVGAVRWPPHEDETLVFFVSRQPLGELFSTVFEERGGAPLHFLLAHAAESVWSGVLGLRLISVAFAVASIPVIAALAARLADRRTALAATAIAAASWMAIYHGIYARMYAIFLFTSALSFLLLLRALERRGWTPWLWWGLATLAAIATQPYGVFVLAICALFVLLRRIWSSAPIRPALLSIAAVTLAAIPLWLVYRVLADRFDVGVAGSSGSKLGSPVDVLQYLVQAAGDFTVGWTPVVAVVLLLAAFGLGTLAWSRPTPALLCACVFLVPTVAFLVTRSGSSVSLESRHVIFALPFFATVVAVGLVRLGSMLRLRGALLVIPVALLIAGEMAWGWHRTPWIYSGEPGIRKEARDDAAAWLAATSRADDVLFGYEPLYLDAAGRGAPFGDLIVPRADPGLALDTLEQAPKPLGRGVWVFDATDQLDASKQRFTIENVSPGAEFESRAFGPFLVIRTKERVRDAETFFRDTAMVQFRGRLLGIGDAGLNHQTAVTALRRLREQR
jgi:Dolichyl-phosphate-mannose-protein mannosyltransferase